MSKYILLQAKVFERDGIPRPKHVKKNAILEWAREQSFTIIDEIDQGKSINPLIPREEWELYISRQRPTVGTTHDPENASCILRRLERIEECVELILTHLTSTGDAR